MKTTRTAKAKGLKRLCIYIWTEGGDTYIDHVGDGELLAEYKRGLKEEMIAELHRNLTPKK